MRQYEYARVVRFFIWSTMMCIVSRGVNVHSFLATSTSRFFRSRYHPAFSRHSIPLKAAGTSPETASHTPAVDFLKEVEVTVASVFKVHNLTSLTAQSTATTTEPLPSEVPARDRESVAIARHLHRRLQALRRNNDCPQCWFQRAHCICEQCPPIISHNDSSCSSNLNRIFLILHHKEVGLKVDTAKLILSTFPQQARLVVAGIPAQHQASMREMQDALQHRKCLVLFPDDDARTFAEHEMTTSSYDLIVLDGTWSQARKMCHKYIPKDVARVQLSQEAVSSLGTDGHQLRRHAITWRQVGTFEAFRLFLQDASQKEIAAAIRPYQDISNAAALRELGPPRKSE